MFGFVGREKISCNVACCRLFSFPMEGTPEAHDEMPSLYLSCDIIIRYHPRLLRCQVIAVQECTRAYILTKILH
jgi:hypothetical protein